MSTVLVASYTGKLTSNSVVTKQPLPFTTLSELVKWSDYKWGLSPRTSMETFMEVSKGQAC